MAQLRIYLQALRYNWWIVALTAFVAAAGTLLIGFTSQPVYRTQLQLLIVPNTTEFDGRDLIYSLDTLDRRSIVATYVEVAGSSRVWREAIQAAGLGPDEAADYQLSVVALPEASVLEIVASGPDPQTVADLANAASEQTTNYISQTYDIFRLEQLDPAPIPNLPISPTPWQDAGLALVLGLALGSMLAILREQVREPLTVTLQQWQARDHATSAYKRKFLERQLEQLLPEESARFMITIVHLEGLVTLDLPTQVAHRLMRRIVTIMRDELSGRDLIGHWDDHSFVVVIRRVSSFDGGYRKLEQLQQELSQPVELFPGGEVVDLSPRLGAVISREGDTLSSIKERLSMAIVQAEKNGREPLLYQQEVERQARQPEGA